MGYGLMGYNDNRKPSAKAIAEENESMLRRQSNFRVAADYVAAAFSEIPEVQRVVLFGSVPTTLVEEVPRFRRYRIHNVAILHECKDIDLAVWVSDFSCLKALQKARGQALNNLLAERNIGVAHHQVKVFLIDPVSGKFVGNLCSFGTCPKGKQDCWVPGYGEPPFVKKFEGFTLYKNALSPEKIVVLYEKSESGQVEK